MPTNEFTKPQDYKEIIMQPNTEVVKSTINDMLSELARYGRKSREEVKANSDALHECGECYTELQRYAEACIMDNPDHGICVVIQIGFQLGLRVAQRQVQ